MTLTEAGQAEILRAAQRDDDFKKRLGEDVTELLQIFGGIRYFVKYRDVCKVLSNILYDTLTTMLNLQTLGEEYTGMVQVNRSGTSLPKKHVQLLMILLNNCGKQIVDNGLQKFEKKVELLCEKQPENSNLWKLVIISNTLKTINHLIERLHKALFYFNGGYYEVAKHLVGIKYVLVRYWLKDTLSVSTFRILGIVSFIHVLLQTLHTIYNIKNLQVPTQNKSDSTLCKSETINESAKCPLCLNKRQNTSVTPCGHLFCWACIITWLQEQPKCPICRNEFKPSRVVFLQNYSK